MKIILASAAALTTLVTPAHAGHHASAPGTSCVPAVAAKSGNNSFRLHVTADPCGWRVRAAATCFPIGAPVTYWAFGPVLTAPGVSKAQCNTTVRTDPVGAEYEGKTGAWRWKWLGPHPKGVLLEPASRRCSPHMYDRRKGTFSFTAKFLRDPCALQLRAWAECITSVAGVDGAQWKYGPILAKAGSSKASCPLTVTVAIAEWGWQWRPNRLVKWRMVEAAPFPKGSRPVIVASWAR